MKKLITVSAILFTSLAANAQDIGEPIIDRNLVFSMVNICATILVIYLISTFILQIIRQNFDYRLKNKIIEKGTAENIVTQLVQPEKKDNRLTVLQWFCVLASIGIGFILIAIFRPYGIHSIAIMALSIAAGFGAYYLFTKPSDKL